MWLEFVVFREAGLPTWLGTPIRGSANRESGCLGGREQGQIEHSPCLLPKAVGEMCVAFPQAGLLMLPVSLGGRHLRDSEFASLVDPVRGDYLDGRHSSTRDAQEVHSV